MTQTQTDAIQAAVLTGPGRIEVIERPRPVPGPGELVVEVAFCGICGTDLHALNRELLPAGSILGHECAGVVVQAGAGCEHRVGERVVVRPAYMCGECAY